jgi:hypothetical protein
MALVVGRLWDRFVNFAEEKHLRRKTAVSYFLLVIFSLAGIIGFDIFIKMEYPGALNGVLLSTAVFAAVLLSSLLFYIRKKRTALFISIIASILLLSFPLNLFVLPVIGREESSRELCLWANELIRPEEPLAGESDLRRGIAFYTGRTDVPDIQNYQKMIDFFSQNIRVWGIIKKKHYRQLDKNKPGLLTAPLMSAGKKVLVTNNINDIK